jgi:hypothetical protein
VHRFELKLIVRGFECWRHTTPDACKSEPDGQCRWLGGGGGGGGGGPAAELWTAVGRPCALDEAAQMDAIQEFYVSHGCDGGVHVDVMSSDW